MNNKRNQLHEVTMIILYDAITFINMDINFDIEEIISAHLDKPYADVETFVKEMVIKSLINKDQIIDDIQAHMPNWKFKKINRLAQAILLQAVTHYRYVETVDKRIVIDNAVKLAKKYLDDGDYRLINAVLDATL